MFCDKPPSVVIVFLWNHPDHLVCGSLTTERFFKCFSQVFQKLHRSGSNFTPISWLRVHTSTMTRLDLGFLLSIKVFSLLEPQSVFAYCVRGPWGKVLLLRLSLQVYLFWGPRCKQGVCCSASPLLGPRPCLLSPHGCLNPNTPTPSNSTFSSQTSFSL